MDSEIVRKIEYYCAYQERSHKEVRYKLVELGSRGEDLEEILAYLITQNFLNEERFAQSFARGKFYHKKWGKKKITKELKYKGVSPYLINKGLKEIQQDDYLNTLRNLMIKKFEDVKNNPLLVKKKKVYNFLMNKGYEHALINQLFTDLGL